MFCNLIHVLRNYDRFLFDFNRFEPSQTLKSFHRFYFHLFTFYWQNKPRSIKLYVLNFLLKLTINNSN